MFNAVKDQYRPRNFIWTNNKINCSPTLPQPILDNNYQVDMFWKFVQRSVIMVIEDGDEDGEQSGVPNLPHR